MSIFLFLHKNSDRGERLSFLWKLGLLKEPLSILVAMGHFPLTHKQYLKATGKSQRTQHLKTNQYKCNSLVRTSTFTK